MTPSGTERGIRGGGRGGRTGGGERRKKETIRNDKKRTLKYMNSRKSKKKNVGLSTSKDKIEKQKDSSSPTLLQSRGGERTHRQTDRQTEKNKQKLIRMWGRGREGRKQHEK